ncbi:MAG TPA: ABC transporter substrate-binding protein, partial [Streptosporangiaceae bacterium]|nr:ABC transporter substrate-binding protein [Streptosporangiaceae bacterium]
MRFRVTAARALIAASALVVLAACGGGGSSSSAGPGNGGSGGAGSPVHGGNLVFDAVQDAQSMNNTTVFDNNSIWIFEQIFEPLYTVTNDGKGVRPYLATSYTKSADGKTYTFKLRKGVEFSTGKPMTSADVKFSIDQNRKATAGWAYLDTAISSVDDPSPDTVVIHLKFPWAPLLADLSIFANDIVPNNYGGESEAQFYTHPVGTGPFKWAFWHKGQALKLVKNTHYWQKGLPYLNSITWNDVPSDNTRELNLKGGSAQIDQFPAWSTVASLKTTPGVTMNLFNSTQTNYLAFNEERKPFQDVHVRRAISLAIDRNALV